MLSISWSLIWPRRPRRVPYGHRAHRRQAASLTLAQGSKAHPSLRRAALRKLRSIILFPHPCVAARWASSAECVLVDGVGDIEPGLGRTVYMF